MYFGFAWGWYNILPGVGLAGCGYDCPAFGLGVLLGILAVLGCCVVDFWVADSSGGFEGFGVDGLTVGVYVGVYGFVWYTSLGCGLINCGWCLLF